MNNHCNNCPVYAQGEMVGEGADKCNECTRRPAFKPSAIRRAHPNLPNTQAGREMVARLSIPGRRAYFTKSSRGWVINWYTPAEEGGVGWNADLV